MMPGKSSNEMTARSKVKQVQKKLSGFMSDKKNRKVIFLVIGAVLIYFVYQKFFKGQQTTTTTTTTREADDKETETTGGGAWVNPYPSIPGTVTAKLQYFSYPEHLNMQVSGDSKNWTFTDISNTVLDAGFENWYFMSGGDMIKTQNKLTYYWPSNLPLSFEKMQIKIGTPDLYFLGQDRTDNSLIQSFSMNNSVAFQSFVFTKL